MNDTTDWFETERIGEQSYRITEGVGYLPCNTYLLGDSEEWLLIDAGLGIGDLRAHTESICDSTPRVLLTHTHWDHIGNAYQFDDVTVSILEQEDGTVSTTTVTDGGVDLSEVFVTDWQELGNEFPDGFEPSEYEIQSLSGVDPIEAGDRVEIGSKTIELLPIPGHSPGQLAALDRAAGVCYGADIISPDGDVFAQFDDSDITAYADSVARLIEYRDDGAFDVLATGHGKPFEGDELSVLNDVKAAIDAVLAGDVEPGPADDFWGPVIRYTVGEIGVLVQSE